MAEMQEAEVIADTSELDTVAAEIKAQESADSNEQKSVTEDILPDEFKGKTVSEIAGIALHARREMGRQANELGEVRRLADELIKSTLHKPKEQEVGNEIDFFENPSEAIRRAVETNPTVQNANNYAMQAQRELAKNRMYQLHPDADKIIQDSGFSDWIGKSQIRKQLFQQANDFNVEAADELFSTYKELKAVRTANVSGVEKAARTKSMNAAFVESGGSGETSKKIFRRADIMKMMTHDRKKYDALSEQIALAYQEGRVR